ncbi:GNAT family N-acetyltransferase [Saccharicrinis aurantiacus]|uniref:GNAT family N-acetyltransferase n=1 Tax=Saccharicrinis aurantiacus TaxID=1849719 RepID=UPI002490BBFD|nr:GNAT family N-acetyltransferase [Saccharicrinis aurantiacus]
MEIRELKNKDIDAVVELWYNVSIQAHSFIPNDYWEKNKEAMASQYLPGSECYLAIIEEKIVGFVAMVDNYLAAIFVQTNMQGSGIGKNLLDFIKSKRETIQLKVYKNNSTGIQFYKHQGFSILSESIEESTNEVEYHMEWKKSKTMNFIKTDITETINDLRSQLYLSLKAPIDAMWEQLYIGSSQHYLIENKDKEIIGYCCINEEGCLTQIFLSKKHLSLMDKVIKELIESGLIQTASLSSNEPVAFNACMFHSKSVKTNTFCFQHLNKEVEVDTNLNIELVTTNDIPLIKLFLKEQVGIDDTFGYTENLVSRKEIFMLKEAETIIATSECRMSDSQPEIADLGIIVNRDFQGKGLATQIMKMQVNRVLKAGRKPICSTTLDNVASRKAIEKAGFYCSNIIFDINFKEDNN